MPQIEKPDGTRIPTEIIMNPAAVINRKNISQLYECALTKIVQEMYRRAESYIVTGDIAGLRKMLAPYYKGKFDRFTDDEIRENHVKLGLQAYAMEVGFYSKVSYNELVEWMKDLGIKDTDVIFCPDVALVETKDGLKGYLMNEYKPQPGEKPRYHELGYIESECITGLEYVLKLHHVADVKGKVTSSAFDTQEPVMGRGRFRPEGQSIG